MGRACAVRHCESHSNSVHSNKVHFFLFPSDYSKPWRDIVNRGDWRPKKNSRICSLHFSKSDIVGRRLRQNAIPYTPYHAAVQLDHNYHQDLPTKTLVASLREELDSARLRSSRTVCELHYLRKRQQQLVKTVEILESALLENCESAYYNLLKMAGDPQRTILETRRKKMQKGRQICSVKHCFSNSKDIGISLFKPRNGAVKEKWVTASPHSWKTGEEFFVCSLHFPQAEMHTDSKGNLRLNDNRLSVPSIFNRISEDPDDLSDDDSNSDSDDSDSSSHGGSIHEDLFNVWICQEEGPGYEVLEKCLGQPEDNQDELYGEPLDAPSKPVEHTGTFSTNDYTDIGRVRERPFETEYIIKQEKIIDGEFDIVTETEESRTSRITNQTDSISCEEGEFKSPNVQAPLGRKLPSCSSSTNKFTEDLPKFNFDHNTSPYDEDSNEPADPLLENVLFPPNEDNGLISDEDSGSEPNLFSYPNSSSSQRKIETEAEFIIKQENLYDEEFEIVSENELIGKSQTRKRGTVSHEEDESASAKVIKMSNVERRQSKNISMPLGNKLPIFSDSNKISKDHLPFDIDNTNLPYDYLCLFLDDEITDKIVEETKRYALQCNNPAFSERVDRKLIPAQQAILYLTGYLNPTHRRMFWEQREDTQNLFARKAMTRQTFEDCMRYTHFVNSSKPDHSDPFWKVRPLFQSLNKSAAKYVQRTEFVSIDMTRGKSMEYKIWVLATDHGELLRCEPYAGAKSGQFNFGLSQGPDVVYGLVRASGLPPGTKLVCTNSYFTSLALVDNLGQQGYGIVGSVRERRLDKISIAPRCTAKNMQPGEYDHVYVDNDKIVLLWRDVLPVYLVSNFADIGPLAQSHPSGGEHAMDNVLQPNIVKVYKRQLGALQLNNTVNHLAIITRSKKWYWPLYNWFLNVSMVQAWRLFRKVGKLTRRKDQETIPLLDFMRSCVATSIWKNGNNQIPSELTISECGIHTRKDEGNHMIIKAGKIYVCKHCKETTGKEKSTVYKCRRCKVGLHADCFEGFHN